ncbi:hypothetical protein [Rhizobium leguminosarum]|uniref:hypothetical protein n=1 Tax=Rhizobium leguminosarum TaxID=384 RepID=UPI001030E8C9|nr:hypothetical protein [Rhizobium leguminosarum]TAY37192.1 hypothetical protein ELH89_08735 [Rhizobium leguminosarum]
MAASPRVKLIGTRSDGFSKWVLFVTIAAIAATIAAVSWWKLGYERQQNFLIDAYRDDTIEQAVRKCGNDIRCIPLELRRSRGSADAFVRSLQDETADWTFLLLVLGVMTGGISILGLIWIRASLLAAREANNINAAAIMTSERAWVFSTVAPDGEVEYFHDGEVTSLHIKIINRNAGKSAAINVHTNIHSSDLSRVSEVMDLLAKESLQYDSARNGVLLGPGEEYNREWVWTSHDRFEIEFRTAPVLIVGCVTYETLFDDEKHQTGFVYIIGEPTMTGGPPTLRLWSGGFAT